jgi:hypothetical protein
VPARLVALALLVVLAGCSQPPPALPAVEPEAPGRQGRADGPESAAGAPDEVVVTSGQHVEAGAPTVTWTTYSTGGKTTANAAGWGWDTALALGVRAMDLYVPPNATALVIELEWDDGVQDLDAEAHAPRQSGLGGGPSCGFASLVSPRAWCDLDGSIAFPDSPSRIDLAGLELAGVLDDCDQPSRPQWGDCNVFALGFRSKDANALLDWHLVATVFVGGPPPDGFSALATSS